MTRATRLTIATAAAALAVAVVPAEDASPVRAAVTSTAISIVADGSAPFDGDDLPGNDDGARNGVVRTLDTVQYRFEYRLDGAGGTAVITSTLPAGMRWAAVPPECTGTGTPPSGISDSGSAPAPGDRRRLVCRTATGGSGTAQITPVARVDAGVADGTVLSVSFTVDDGTGPVTSATVPVTATSGPWFGVEQRAFGTPRAAFGPGPGGTQPGSVRLYTVSILVDHPTRTGADSLRGLAQLASPVTLVDDLSAYGRGARVYDWDPDAPACGPIAVGTGGPAPYSRRGSSGLATAETAVLDSGTVSCSSMTSDTTFTVRFDGPVTAVEDAPTREAEGAPIDPGTVYVATGYVRIWLPNSAIVDGPDQTSGTADDGFLESTNRYVDFAPLDVTGNPNRGGAPEDTTDNAVTGASGTGVTFQSTYRGTTGPLAVETASGLWAGDAEVSTGFVVGVAIDSLTQALDAPAPLLCHVFDATAQRPAGQFVLYSGFGSQGFYDLAPQAGVVEYGVASSPATSVDDLRDATCDDDDAVWSTDPTDPALGGELYTVDGFTARSTIDRVRFRAAGPQPAFGPYLFAGKLQITGRSDLTGIPADAGSLVTTFGRARYGEGDYLPTTYDPVTHTPFPSGDRLRYVDGLVGVSVGTDEVAPGAGDQVGTGDVVTWRVQPSVSVPGQPTDPVDDVTATVVLADVDPTLQIDPATIGLPVGSPPAAQVLDGCTVCDGSDWAPLTSPTPVRGLRWRIGDVVPGTAVGELSFRTAVPAAALAGTTYVADALAASPDDPRPANERRASASVQVVTPASVEATNVAEASPVGPPVGGRVDAAFELALVNRTTVTLAAVDLVQLLPDVDVGDVEVDVPSGWAVYVSSTARDALDAIDGVADGVVDPGRPGSVGFVAPGTGAWSCTLAAARTGLAGCPRVADLTAIRVVPASTSSTVAPAASLEVVVRLDVASPAGGEVLATRFAARVDDAASTLLVVSPVATVDVAPVPTTTTTTTTTTTVTSTTSSPPTTTTPVTSPATSVPPVTTVPPPPIASAPVVAAGGVLPSTGTSVALLLVLAGSAATIGVALRRAGRGA